MRNVSKFLRTISAWAGSWKRDQERNERDYDFDILEASGFTGVVFENEATGTRYHTTRDTVDAISEIDPLRGQVIQRLAKPVTRRKR